MLLLLTKKSALKLKDFFTLCTYPSLEKRIYFRRFLNPATVSQPLQKAGQFHVQWAANGPGQQGADD